MPSESPMKVYYEDLQRGTRVPLVGNAVCAMNCIGMVAHDMYAGLAETGFGEPETVFLDAVRLYHEVKFGLRDGNMDNPPVDDHSFFVLKKCIFHWVKGISLALVCGGMEPDEADRLAAMGCGEALYRPVSCPEDRLKAVKARYDLVVSGEIRKQYARPDTVPSNEWCAWLELEAVKTVVYPQDQ